MKFNKIAKCFCADITATACAQIVGVKCNTVNSYYNDFRRKIMLAVLEETRSESGEFEVDESYFGAKRVRDKRGRGAAGKKISFRASKKRWKSHRQNRSRLFERKFDAHNSRTSFGRLDDSF